MNEICLQRSVKIDRIMQEVNEWLAQEANPYQRHYLRDHYTTQTVPDAMETYQREPLWIHQKE